MAKKKNVVVNNNCEKPSWNVNKWNKEAKRRQQQQQMMWDSDDEYETSDDEDEFQPVRGIDGRLYHVRNPSYESRQQRRRRRRQQKKKKKQQQQRRNSVRRQQEDDDDDESEFEIVRGTDGRLYTVRRKEEEEPQLNPRRKSKTKNVGPSTMKPKTKTIP